jgi:DMSO reductase family type II enzyme heme b subunit
VFVEHKQPWPTLTGRQQFYIDHEWYLAAGEELPTHKEPPKAGGDYPLRLTGSHTRWSIHSIWRDEPRLLRLQRGEPTLYLGSADAAARGIRDNDRVRVFNDVGACELLAKISPAIEPGQVVIYHAWEPLQFKGHEDATPNREIVDTNVFPDACGILMPLGGGDPPIDEMGSAAAPVNAWYWRASAPEEARNVVAGGLGTTRATAQSPVRARSLWEDGAWAVVFTRPLTVSGQAQEATPLAAGGAVKVGFAVWEGSNGERAGLKSFSREWRELTLDA